MFYVEQQADKGQNGSEATTYDSHVVSGSLLDTPNEALAETQPMGHIKSLAPHRFERLVLLPQRIEDIAPASENTISGMGRVL